jgi:hypothetical protein
MRGYRPSVSKKNAVIQLGNEREVLVRLPFFSSDGWRQFNTITAKFGHKKDNEGLWHFPREHKEEVYTLLCDVLKEESKRNPDLTGAKVVTIPDWVFGLLKEFPEDLRIKVKEGQHLNSVRIKYTRALEENYKLEMIPEAFLNKLYAFQKEGIKFGLNKGGRLLIGDEMGVGKTIQALGIAAIYKADWPIYIFCPATLKYNWLQESIRWLEGLVEEKEIQVIETAKEAFKPESRILILSYDTAKRSKPLQQLQFVKTVIVDEAHYLKNPDSERCQVLIPFIQKAKRVIMLTGTPALSKPFELFSILTCLRPDIYQEAKWFGERYCDPQQCPFSRKIQYKGCDNIQELNFLLNRCMIRRLKRDILPQLPQTVRHQNVLPIDEKYQKEIKKINDRFDGRLLANDIESILNRAPSDGEEGGGPDIHKSLMMMYELTAKAKLDSVCEFIEDMMVCGEKLVIFAHHKVMLDGLETLAKKLKVDYIRIDGTVEAMQRGKLVADFQNDSKDVRLALLSIKACATGLTLTKACKVIFAELYWNPSDMLQAEGRCNRVTQESNVDAYYLIGKDTLDPKIMDMISKKFTIVSGVLDGENAEKYEFQKKEIPSKQTGTLDGFFSKKEFSQPSMASMIAKSKLSKEDEEELRELEDELKMLNFGAENSGTQRPRGPQTFFKSGANPQKVLPTESLRRPMDEENSKRMPQDFTNVLRGDQGQHSKKHMWPIGSMHPFVKSQSGKMDEEIRSQENSKRNNIESRTFKDLIQELSSQKSRMVKEQTNQIFNSSEHQNRTFKEEEELKMQFIQEELLELSKEKRKIDDLNKKIQSTLLKEANSMQHSKESYSRLKDAFDIDL